jgi:hypothetical protein
LRATLYWGACLVLGGCISHHYKLESSCIENKANQPLLTPVDYSWTGHIPNLVESAPEPPPERGGIKHNISEALVRSMQGKQLTGYQVQELEYPSAGENGQPGNRVRVRYLKRQAPGPAPLVIVLPIWGTFQYPAEKLSWKLREHFKGDVNIVLLLSKNRLVKWGDIGASASRDELLQHSQASAEQVRVTAQDIRGLLRWAESRPEIDGERIALTGFSIGAIVASLVAVEEPRLAATVLVMGAGNPAEVMASCNRVAGQSRKTAIKTLGLSQQEYEQTMHQAFDVLDWVKQGVSVEDPSRFMIIDANSDDCMPKSAREALWVGLHRPERYTFRGNHHRAFLSMTPVGANVANKLIANYIEQQFERHESPVRFNGAPIEGGACPVREHSAGNKAKAEEGFNAGRLSLRA